VREKEREREQGKENQTFVSFLSSKYIIVHNIFMPRIKEDGIRQQPDPTKKKQKNAIKNQTRR
jgi:Zn-dependent metalloprotease